jgi:outer membrane protein assembly factor BamB
MIKSVIISFLIGLSLLTGCGEGMDFKEDATSVVNLTSVTDIDLEIISEDKQKNTAQVHITSKVDDAVDISIYDNSKKVSLDSGTVEDGLFTLSSGTHDVQVCAIEEGEEKCSRIIPLLISENLALSSYKKIPILDESFSLTNDGKNLFYGTGTGELYALDLDTQESTLFYNVHTLVNGLVFENQDNFYYSSVYTGAVSHLDIKEGTEQNLANLNFPDALDLYNGELYVVENDQSGILSVFNKNGTVQRRVNTEISDITGITHTDKYLYILSEDGEIFQTNSATGKSVKIFTNDNFFTAGNNTKGLEGITIFDNNFFVTYVDDKSIYRINIDIKAYE